MIYKTDLLKELTLDLSLSKSNPRLNVKCFVLCEMFYGGGYISAQHRTQPGLAGTYVLF